MEFSLHLSFLSLLSLIDVVALQFYLTNYINWFIWAAMVLVLYCYRQTLSSKVRSCVFVAHESYIYKKGLHFNGPSPSYIHIRNIALI